MSAPPPAPATPATPAPATAVRPGGTAPSAARPERARSPRRRTPRGARLTRGQRLLATVLVLVVAGGAGWLVGFSSVLDTRDVSVTGQQILTADAVREAAAVPLGRPLARQDTDEVVDRVAALPPVESVRVERDWPHTLAVSVVERRPVMAVPGAGGVLLVDRAGVPFATVPSAPPGVPRAEVDLADPALVAEAGVVAAGLAPQLAKRVSSIEVRTPDAIRVIVDGKIPVMWGGSAESPLKSAIVSALLKRKPKAIDVSAPNTPAVR